MPRTFRSPASGVTASNLREYEKVFQDVIDDSEELPDDLRTELEGYKNALNTLYQRGSTKPTLDDAVKTLSGLNRFLTGNYDKLCYYVDPPQMGVFMDMLRKADNTLELGINFDRIFDEEQEKKEAFVENIASSNYSLPGDAALADLLYEARTNADGSISYSYAKELNNLHPGKLMGSGTRQDTLESLRYQLTKIPEEGRTEKQKEAIAAIGRELDRLPELKEAEKFAEETSSKGWSIGQTVLRNMYFAGRELPPDHEYNKLLNELHEGKTRFHPEFPTRWVKKDKEHVNGIVQDLQTSESLSLALDLLEKSGKAETPWGKKAVSSMQQDVKNLKTRAEEDRKGLQQWEKWTGLSEEQKAKLKGLHDAIFFELQKEQDQEKRLAMGPVMNRIDSVLVDPKTLSSHNQANSISRQMDELPDRLSKMLDKLGPDHPIYKPGMQILEDLAPETAKGVKTAQEEKAAAKAAAEARKAQEDAQKAQEELENEISAFQVMKDNIDRVKNSHTIRSNSSQYNNLSAELKACAEAKSRDELEAAKSRLATRAKEYLDHTGLGRASKLHQNAEPRRQLAFLALSMTDPIIYADYAKRANLKRGAEDRIDANALANLEGIGRPMPKVRGTSFNALAGAAPARPERKSHVRTSKVSEMTEDKKLEEPKAPTMGGMNRPNS